MKEKTMITKQAQNMSKENSLTDKQNQAYIDIVGAKYAKADEAEESYQGEYESDEDFARNMAEELGSIDKNAVWPYIRIDWEYAAKELMYDYSENSGFYFRDL